MSTRQFQIGPNPQGGAQDAIKGNPALLPSAVVLGTLAHHHFSQRLVYEVDPEARMVKSLALWTHDE